MKKLYTTIIVCLLAATTATLAGALGYCWNNADEASPIIFRYIGTNTTHTYTITATNLLLVDGSTSQYFAFQNSLNASGLVSLINADTNAVTSTDPNAHPWEAKVWAALSTDVLSNRIVAVASTVATPKVWDYGMKWDSSITTNYEVMLTSMFGTAPLGGILIHRVVGDPLGTGNATFKLYQGDTKLWQFTVTTNNPVGDTEVRIPPSGFEFAPGIITPKGKVIWGRCSMGLTATTGGMGAEFESQP